MSLASHSFVAELFSAGWLFPVFERSWTSMLSPLDNPTPARSGRSIVGSY
jgi:hypothetical protein